MTDLVQITTNEQGSPVVSAREVHSFLEVKSRFNDWIKNRIIKYDFQENIDFVTLTKTLVSGGLETDYALTLDMAKELAMVERTAKGREARLYFIEAEKALRHTLAIPPAPASLSVEQVLLQQAHALVEQGGLIAQLRADVDQLLRTSRPKTAPHLKGTPELNFPAKPALLSPLRQTISRHINEYCNYHNATQSQAYSYLYKRLHDVYGINAYRLMKAGKESLLDALERYGHLDRLYSLIVAELTYVEE